MTPLKGIIFVSGASRSGTTMLSRILGQHSSVRSMNELHYFGDLFDISGDRAPMERPRLAGVLSRLFARYRKGLWNDRIEAVDVENAESLIGRFQQPVDGAELFRRFIEHVAAEAGASFVAEQTPRNIYYAADLLAAYPDARIIHIVRDPRAVIASQKKRWTRRKALNAKNIPFLEMAREWISYHPYTMCLLWKKAYIAGRSVESSSRYMRVRFEDLAEDPRVVIAKICGFIGIGFEEAMLDVPQIDSSVRTADNAARGIQKNSVDSWKRVLSRGETLVIEKRLHEEMGELGYAVTNDAPGISGYFTVFRIMLAFPAHMVGVFAINPRRFLVQLKGIMRGYGRASE